MNGEMYRAGQAVLGARLMAAASLVRKGGVAADIGCDHGKMAVYLVKAGIAKKVIAVDNRPMPLAKAKALVEQAGVEEQVDCRLGDGLKPLAPKEANEIVIAGMSGETMVEILEKAEWIRDEEVSMVFVPARKTDFLREWLCRQGFEICREIPVEEKGRFYTALQAAYTGVKTEPEPLFCLVGLVPQTVSPAAKGVLLGTREHLKKMSLGLKTPEQLEKITCLIGEIDRCLQLQK